MTDSTDRACGFDDCDKPYYAKGWCKNHYRKFAVKPCKEEGCDKPSDSRGWCSMHYMRWWSHGDSTTVLGRRPTSDDSSSSWCPRCEKFKPVEEFRTWIRKRDSKEVRDSYCKSCHDQHRREHRDAERQRDPMALKAKDRAANLRRYGLTPEQYDVILARQGGACAICKRIPDDDMYLEVDHDHWCCPGTKSCGGCVRALLCGDCNTVFGRAGDCAELLVASAVHLLKLQGLPIEAIIAGINAMGIMAATDGYHAYSFVRTPSRRIKDNPFT